VRCWPWSHTYTIWEDTAKVEKRRSSDGALVAVGVEQQCRCTKCGKLKVRLELRGIA
jgi:hypothetical protein